MLENNKEYQAITALEKTINKAEETRSSLENLKGKKEKLKSVSMTPEHKYFPYGQALNQLEEDGRKCTAAKIIMHALYILIPYSMLFALPVVAFYFLDFYGIIDMGWLFTHSTYQFVLAGAYAVVIVVTVLTVFKYSRKIWRGQTRRRFKRLQAARHDTLAQTFEESETEIGQFEEILITRTEALEKDIKALEDKMETYHQKIEDNTMIPKKFIPDIESIIQYFEDNRVKNIKDAINLLVAEKRQDQMFETLKNTMEKGIEELTSMKDVLTSIESLEEKISQQPVAKEEDYESDEARVLDAKLKTARTKKERKKLEKKKRKLEKKEKRKE